MVTIFSRRTCGRAILAGAMAMIAAAVLPSSVGAQAPTDRQLIEQLLGKSSRSATAAKTATPAEVARLRELLSKAGTRAFTAKERTEIAEVTKDRPSIDFEIYFPFNSSAVQKTALETMQRLGQILSNAEFKDRGFLIAGHTDAKGSDKANQIVSQRRAEAVKAFLVKNYNIDPNRLRVIGYGKEQLKDAGQPFAEINRRVQIINLPDGTLTASR
jgi:outer membrane protein OmpA-like peptidoglycan-associated protein